MGSTPMPESNSSGRGAALRWLALGALAIAIVALARSTGVGAAVTASLQAFLRWVPTLGPWGPVAFVAGYVAATVAFVPGSLLTLAAGAIFGLVAGTIYVFVAASLAACTAFALARTVARGALERRFAGNARFAAIDRAIAAEGRKIAFLLRLSPVFPFSLLNYALGLTRVRFGDYALACLGMLPGTLLYVYLGSLAGDAAGRGAGGQTRLEWIFKVMGLVVTLVVTLVITRTARRALRDATGDEQAR
jgi:uncharacterized membrane protein YdjX (TVP38/TMEM64 family)